MKTTLRPFLLGMKAEEARRRRVLFEDELHAALEAREGGVLDLVRAEKGAKGVVEHVERDLLEQTEGGTCKTTAVRSGQS